MSTRKRFCCDDETGEIITFQVNEETGEPSIINNVKQSLPQTLDRNPIEDTFYNFQSGYFKKSKKFKALKEKIITRSNTTSPRMFLLITTFMIYPSLVCGMLMLLETFLHISCHKKNRNLQNPNVYYRSPFHIISSMFCGLCRECDMSSKIGQIQDKRRHQYDNFKEINIFFYLQNNENFQV